MTLRTQRLVASVLLAALLGGFGWLIYRLTNPSTGSYEVRVTLHDADGLHKDSDVKIGGVSAGVVTSLKVVHRGRGTDVAEAVLALEERAGAIGAGARARVRPVNLLGEKYLDLVPGDVAHAQPSGSAIPLSRTGATVGLDDVLNLLDADTRTRVGILINETGVALTGRATGFRSVLSQLPSSLEDSRRVLAEIAAQDAALRQLITQSRRVLSPLADQRDDLADLIVQAERTLAVTADRQTALGATIAAAPAGLAELRRTLDALSRTASELEPATVDLRRVAAPLSQTLAAVPDFASAAHEALDVARSVAPTITRLAVRATPPIRRLQPSLAAADELLRASEPIVRGLARENGAKTLLYFLQTWARVVKAEDGLGHLFGANLTVDSTLFGAALDRLNQTDANTRTGAGAKSVPVRRNPRPTGGGSGSEGGTPPTTPKLPTGSLTERLPKVVGGLVDALLGGHKPPVDPPKAAPVTPSDAGVHELLDYLLGG